MIGFIFVVLGVLWIPGAAIALYQGLEELVGHPDWWHPLGIGVVIGGLVTILLLRRWGWFRTLVHESAHALVALLFFRRIRKFRVSARQGGMVSFDEGFGGRTGNLLITLAPYYLPTLCLPVLVAGIFVPEREWIFGLLGGTLSFHLWNNIQDWRQNSTWRRFRPHGATRAEHSDIAKAGWIPAAVTIVALLITFIGAMLGLLTEGGKGLLQWANLSWNNGLKIWAPILVYLIDKIRGWMQA